MSQSEKRRMSRSVVQLNCYTKHHRNTSLTNLHCELKEPVPQKHKNAYNALWNGATGRFILSCFVGDVAVLRKLARLNKKIPRNYDSKRKFVGFLELLTWFEQATCSLRVSCSTSWATVADKIFLHVLQREIFYHTSCALSRFDFAAEQMQIVCDAKI